MVPLHCCVCVYSVLTSQESYVSLYQEDKEGKEHLQHTQRTKHSHTQVSKNYMRTCAKRITYHDQVVFNMWLFGQACLMSLVLANITDELSNLLEKGHVQLSL